MLKWIRNIRFPGRSGVFFKQYGFFRSSIYGRVVLILSLAAVFLFLTFGLIFHSVNRNYMESVIREKAHNIGVLVEGALYRSMLENDRQALQGTLDIINNMSGIDDVNMYDQDDNLVYTSISGDTLNHGNPECKSCHEDFGTMFSRKEKSYRIFEGNTPCILNHRLSEGRHLVMKSPILNQRSCYESSCHAHPKEEDVLGALIIKLPLINLDDALQKSSRDYYLLASLVTALIITFLVIFTNNRIKRPLNELVRASEAVSGGDRGTRLNIGNNQLSDMRKVSSAFNEMLDNLEAANVELKNWSQQLEYKVQKKSEELGQVQKELINIERIASLGKLSLSVAHEINNPLSGILVYTKLIHKQLQNHELDAVKRESMLKHLKLIENETKRCGDIVKGLLDFSRKDQNDFENKHLHEILRDTCELMTHPMKIANIGFFTDFGAENDLVFCSPNQLKQAFIALLVNASEAVSEHGEVIVKTVNTDTQSVRIEIADNGIGISEDDLAHIFEPFFTTKENVSGIGLGLSIVHGIVQSHKGRIEVHSVRGNGTTMILTLPLASK